MSVSDRFMAITDRLKCLETFIETTGRDERLGLGRLRNFLSIYDRGSEAIEKSRLKYTHVHVSKDMNLCK
jgi:hypothetical protein